MIPTLWGGRWGRRPHLLLDLVWLEEDLVLEFRDTSDTSSICLRTWGKTAWTALTLPQTVHSLSALWAIRLGSAIDSISRWERMSAGRRSIKRPKKKNLASHPQGGGLTSYSWVLKGSAVGLWIKSMRRVATSWGRTAMQWWNLVREVVTHLIANWVSAWRNHTSGESVQKVGSLIDTVMRDTWSSGRGGPSSVFDIATNAKKNNRSSLLSESYFGVWVWNLVGTNFGCFHKRN